MPLTDDQWIASKTSLHPAKFHALGIVTFYWNTCEFGLFRLFSHVFQMHPNLAWLLMRETGDISLSNRIREYLQIMLDEPDATAEVILNVLDAYDVCRQNRNQLTHFQLIHNKEDGQFILSRQKGPTMERVPFPDTLTDLRRVGDELWGLSLQLALICQFLQKADSEKREPLPGKVLVPELLWKPPPLAAQAQQPQRPPSVLRLTEEEWIAKYSKEGRPLPERDHP